jgi:hypothetical protein
MATVEYSAVLETSAEHAWKVLRRFGALPNGTRQLSTAKSRMSIQMTPSALCDGLTWQMVVFCMSGCCRGMTPE